MIERPRVLAIAPHPDDETFFWGGTLSTLAEKGAHVHVAVLTNGEKGKLTRIDPLTGQFVTEFPLESQRDAFTLQRRQESLAAADFLGLHGVSFLSFADQRINHDVIPSISALLQDVDPHVVFSFSEAGSTYHPDHTYAAFCLYLAVNCLLNNHRGQNLALRAVYTSFLTRSTRQKLTKWSDVTDRNNIVAVDIRHVRERKREAAKLFRSQAHLVHFFDSIGFFGADKEFYHRRAVVNDQGGRHVQRSLVLPAGHYDSHDPNFHIELNRRMGVFFGRQETIEQVSSAA